ncbi:MAG: LytTR family DNA-binding domain-containing protein [Rikenellaceae bacterium]
MRCIAIDDEPIALSVVEQYCSRMGEMELTTFTDPMAGLAAVKQSAPELLFLDIEMGDVHGVTLAKEVPSTTQIIFTTAYSKFAIDGYDLGAVDFLHKPFPYSRFSKAVERAKERISYNKKENEEKNINDNNEQITVRVEYRNVTIPLAQITHIEAMDNYIRIYTATSQNPIISQMSLKAIASELSSKQFLRIHRSYIVARRWVKSFNKSEITLNASTTKLPIGRIYCDTFLEWIAQ